ncbi:ABC transporter permease [Hyalangium versicolor]|uniref:ABC transporter permease n=1 Tax=Hyalangium versicolor TaxID=2861190 RepID=UPI001CCDB466|nr:ABC transporter permease [Hyalangium versicolor]
MWQDLRFGLRLWTRHPGLALTVLLTLALSIGANTSIFSVIHTVLLRPLPFHEPERLVRVWGVDEERAKQARDAGRNDYGVSSNDLLDWKAESQSFSMLAAYGSGAVSLVNSTGSLQVRIGSVSPEFFPLLGVTPVLGRFFETGKDGSSEDGVIVISESLWRRQFGAERSVLGRTVLVGGAPSTIIGVAPLELEPPIVERRGTPDLWQSHSLNAAPAMRGARWMWVLGRLRPGVTVAQAQEELDAINQRLAKDFPATNTGQRALVMPLADSIVQEIRPALLLLFGAVGFVLLIAGANVANLLVARSAMRHQELAIRAALGASRGRLLRQLLVENVLVALAGGVLGLLLSLWLTDLLVSLSGGRFPRMQQVHVNLWVLCFALGVSLLTGLLLGVLPALQSSRLALQATSGAAGRTASVGRGQKWTRQLLVAGQVALSLILLVGAGMLLQSFWRLQQVDPGFQPEQVLMLELTTPRPQTTRPEQVLATSQRLVDEVRALPGVIGAGTINLLPMGGVNSCQPVIVEGHPPASGLPPCAEERTSSPNYFRAMGVPLLSGRLFDARDTENQPRVVVINSTMARRFFPQGEPLGKRISVGNPARPTWLEVIGVVGDVRQLGLDKEPSPELYQSQFQVPAWQYTLVVRADRDTDAVLAAIRNVVRRIDPEIPLFNVRTAEALLSGVMAQPRFRALLLGLFAALAVGLAAVGIGGIVSWSVAQRTREIGIRMALGARPGDVLRLVMGQGMAAVLAGVAVGLMGALALTRVMEGLLFGLSTTDPMAFTMGVVALTGTALLASYLPTRRALRIDPVEALRSE